jgi:hypothetical protein
MNMRINYQTATEPTAFIAKGKQRVKQYNNTVYLKNGEEFELELFNPLSYKVLAKIKLNGNYLESGIVLRPGERVFLERYINEAKKFVFSTYSVDAKDPVVQKAIESNGDVEVEFYNEIQNVTLPLYTTTYIYNSQVRGPAPCRDIWGNEPNPVFGPNLNPPGVFYSSTADSNLNNLGAVYSSGTYNVNGDTTIRCSCSNSVNAENPEIGKAEKETGRIEKGSYSDQAFNYDGSSFSTYYTWKTSWKILPESQKVYVKEDLVVYCASCGTKRKKDSFKFCPHCGNKY